MIVVSDRIAKACNKTGATRTVVLDKSKTFFKVWHVGFLHAVKSYELSDRVFSLISSFLSSRWLRLVLNTGVP